MIKTYIFKEHNEAYFYWNLAVKEGIIENNNNTLIHIDHHDDLEFGGYFFDVSNKSMSIEEIKNITYNYLGIADFLVPAIFLGLFSSVYNMKALIKKEFVKEERLVRLIDENQLTMNKYIPFIHSDFKKSNDKNYHFFNYYEGSLSKLENNENIILDIDIDYFCWDDSLSSVPLKKIEITEEAYKEYNQDMHHPFKILPRRLLKIREIEGKYYIVYEEPPTQTQIHTLEKIDRRINNFFDWLKEFNIKPKLINICTSEVSGYTPSDFMEYIKSTVISNLSVIYELDIEEV